MKGNNMDSQKFLDDLIFELSENAEIINIGFEEKTNYFLKELNNFNGNTKIFCISSTFFEKNLNLIASMENRNYLESIIGLPIFKKECNLVLLIFNPTKNNEKCLFIDETDSLIHKDDLVDWTYAGEELIPKISNSYNEFSEGESSVILDLSSIFGNAPKKSPKNDFLSLKKDSDEISTRKNRVLSNDIADEILSLKEKSVRDEISKYNIKSSESPNISSFPFLNEAMYYKKRQDPQNLLFKDDKRLIDGEVQFRKLGKISDLQNIYYKNDNDSILIATCKTCNSKLVYYNKDITDFKGEVFIELTNIADTVLIDYLYEYLSSSNGLDELFYFSKGTNFINPQDIKNVKIPIPPIDVQKDIVNVARESREFFKTVDLLKKEFNSNILDYKHMRDSINQLKGDIAFNSYNEITTLSRSWRHAYKGLIWPLAISYLSATKGGFEVVEKKDNYLVLFEFIAAFNAIVLLSGLPDDVYKNNYSTIWNAKKSMYNQMTFANWVYLCKNLSEVYKFNNFTSKLDGDLFDKITDDKLINMLEQAKNLRNDESHGSQSNAYEAKEVIDKLDVYLDDIFDILDVYSDYKLFYTTGDIQSAKNAKYGHRIILLNGPCAQPIYDTVIFDTVLERESLYLYNPKTNKKLLLKDNFVKFSPIDKNKKRWALFVYYSCDRNEYNAFYKCFQSKEKDIKINITSLERDILKK